MVTVVPKQKTSNTSTWQRFKWVARLATLTVLLIVVYVTLPTSTDWLAQTIFGNAIPASDNEPAVTPLSPRWSSDEWASLAGRGEGLDCSIPPAALAAFASKQRGVSQASINLRFRQACVAHDLCYRHGRAAYGYTQAQCDNNLVEASFRICKHIYGQQQGVSWCANQARKVLAGVTFGGSGSFRPAFDDGSSLGDQAADFQHATVPAEYDPFPVGNAVYAFPRIFRGDCLGSKDTPILVFYLRRPGGAATSTRCFDGKSFVRVGADGRPTNLPNPAIASSYDRRLGPPWLFDGGTSPSLMQWCRLYQSSTSTSGYFFVQRHPLSFLGCPANLDEQDRDVVSPFPVPGLLSATIPAVGISETQLTMFTATATEGQPRSHAGPACLAGGCNIPLPPACDHTKDRDRYRWMATTPVVIDATHRVGGGMSPAAQVTLFARGCGTESDYQSLVSLSAGLAANGFEHPPSLKPQFDRPAYWNVPEAAEPLIPVEEAGRITGLISVQAVAQPNGGTRTRWIQWLDIIAVVALIGATTMLLGFSRRDMAASGLFALIAVIAGGVSHALGTTLSNDGFSQDAQIVLYKPGDSLPHAKAVKFPIVGGRPWLQQRLSVVRQSDDYEIILPRFRVNSAKLGMILDVRIAHVSPRDEKLAWENGTIDLPLWIQPSHFSRLMTIPFRDRRGDLNLLVIDPNLGGGQTVVRRASPSVFIATAS